MQIKLYDLFMDIDFKNLSFQGKVAIEIESSEDDVKLNCLGLKVLNAKANGRPLQYQQSDEDVSVLTGPFTGTLEISYQGTVPDSLSGLYRAPYGDTYVFSTQFEANNARRMLPCIDHPAYKAEFKVAVKVDEELSAISNMPVESVKTEGGKKLIAFQKTPKMSTYLLYLGVGKFDEAKEKLDRIVVAAATTPGKASKTSFALDMAKKSVKFFESYFGIPYVLPKLHVIAVPEFGFGAMENWGAITFREILVLADKDTSVRIKKLVAEVMAHEVSHQWFGNLVTMKWWDDLWLNESFATFMAYKAVDSMFPEWKVWHEFLRDTSDAMVRDSLKNTHSIEVPVQRPEEIEEIFDEISYSKGGRILNMMEAFVGAENFAKGVRSYLEKHKYANAKGEDLWKALEEASGAHVQRIMREWLTKPGYPILTVRIADGKLALKQERFMLSGASEQQRWPIPVTMKVNGESKRFLMEDDETMLEAGQLKSLKLNVGQTGFYRVYYPGLYDRVWADELSAQDRYGIVNDALALSIAGKMPVKEYLNILQLYNSENEYLPAYEVSDQLAFLYALTTRADEVSRKFHRSQLSILQDRKDENTTVLRGVMANRLAMVDDDFAEELGSKFHAYDKFEPDMKAAVSTAYARSTGDLEGVLKKYRETGSDEDKLRHLVALLSFKQESLVATSLGLAFSGEVKRQDIRSMMTAMTRNPHGRPMCWLWLRMNIDKLRKLHEGSGILGLTLNFTLPFLGIGRADEAEKFFAGNKVPESEKGIQAGLEKLRIYDRFAGLVDESL